jgi:hypothetical protein
VRATVGGECNTAAREESNSLSEKESQKQTGLWKKSPSDVMRAVTGRAALQRRVKIGKK